MINCRWISKQLGKTLKILWQREKLDNQSISHTLQKFRRAWENPETILQGVRNKGQRVLLYDSQLHIFPETISQGVRKKGQRVLLYDSKLYIFPGKLKSRWIGHFAIHQVYSNGVVELLNSNNTGSFKVNGHLLKPFLEPFSRDKMEVILLEPHQAWQDQWLDGLSMSEDY